MYIYIYIHIYIPHRPQPNRRSSPREPSLRYRQGRYTAQLCTVPEHTSAWPSHDVVIANIVWCMAYTRGLGGGAYITKWACNSIAIG